MVRVTMFFAGGILTAVHFAWSDPSVEIPVLVFLSIAFASGICIKSNILPGAAGLIAVFLMGRMLVAERGRQPCDLNKVGTIIMYQGVVSRFAEERTRSFRTELTLQAVRTSEGWLPSCGTILVYFPREGRPFGYGDVVLVRGSPSEIPAPTNPGEFDFRRFMIFKGIYHQHFWRQDSVKWIRSDPPNSFLHRAILVRQWADAKIKSVVNGERERATASALVLGVTDGLDNELLQAYSSTGALHVLAVSGLHVSIIYWILLLVLKPLDKKPSLRWLLALISVFVLWSYAFVTGWSPSVLRAVTMFSFVAFSRPWRQTTNIYNTLASSMFCLLLYDPFFIMSVGFQLSYLAVFGIVFLQPRLYPLWEPRNRLLDESWKLSSVSIAAQIATLPISLYYFHQFPNYFLPANLVVIPVSFVVLVTGLAVAAFAFVQPLIEVLGWLLTWSVKLMNYLVLVFGQMPFSVIGHIHLDPWQAILLAALIASVTLVFVNKNIHWLKIAVLLAAAISALQWHHFRNEINRDVIRVYNVTGQTVIGRIRDGDPEMIIDSAALSNWRAVSRYVIPSWTRAGVSCDSARSNGRIFRQLGWSAWVWEDISFIRIFDREHTVPTARVTFLVISHNSVETLSSLSGVKCEKIIVDSSNSFYFAERLRNEAKELGLTLWSVPHEGAFEYTHAIR